jgi:hypothetical protein
MIPSVAIIIKSYVCLLSVFIIASLCVLSSYICACSIARVTHIGYFLSWHTSFHCLYQPSTITFRTASCPRSAARSASRSIIQKLPMNASCFAGGIVRVCICFFLVSHYCKASGCGVQVLLHSVTTLPTYTYACT